MIILTNHNAFNSMMNKMLKWNLEITKKMVVQSPFGFIIHFILISWDD